MSGPFERHMTTIRQHKFGEFDEPTNLITRVLTILCNLSEKSKFGSQSVVPLGGGFMLLNIEVVPGTPGRAWSGSMYTRARRVSDEPLQLFVRSRVVYIFGLRDSSNCDTFE